MRAAPIGIRHTRRLAILALPLLLSGTAGPALAAEKDEILAATASWQAAFSDAATERIVALYDNEAVLWGTLSAKRRDDRDGVRDYMVAAFKALPERKVEFGDQLIRVYGETAVNTGDYTFSFTRDGERKTLPARYSLVYRKRAGSWLIVDHHSSAMPPQ
jgi:uncharacterized protein (TIGR02246 family)